MRFEKTLVIGRETADYYQKVLHSTDMMGENETCFETVKFDNGYEMDINIRGVDNEKPWTEAILFNEESSELECTPPDEAFFREWWISYEGDDYIVNVVQGPGKWYCNIHKNGSRWYASMYIDKEYIKIQPCTSYTNLRREVKYRTGIELPPKNCIKFESHNGYKYALIDNTQPREDCRVTIDERLQGWKPNWD